MNLFNHFHEHVSGEIAKKFQLVTTKLACLVYFGIAPYFCHKLIDEIHSSVCYAISFDESLNHLLKEEQMDIVCYVSRNEVVTITCIQSSWDTLQQMIC